MLSAAFAASVISLYAGGASAQSGVEIGKLECYMTDSVNLIIRSRQTLECEFLPISGEPETYTGRITRLGVDLTIRRRFTVIWAVLAPAEVTRQPGTLRGTFVGGTADVALGAGFGANVLVGGGDNSFTLQPLSVAGVLGAGASLGISSLVLE
jgi:hypothetical protein